MRIYLYIHSEHCSGIFDGSDQRKYFPVPRYIVLKYLFIILKTTRGQTVCVSKNNNEIRKSRDKPRSAAAAASSSRLSDYTMYIFCNWNAPNQNWISYLRHSVVNGFHKTYIHPPRLGCRRRFYGSRCRALYLYTAAAITAAAESSLYSVLMNDDCSDGGVVYRYTNNGIGTEY